jgi:hypothetical protein
VREVVDAVECFFVAASAGLVLGLRLRDERRVALKLLRAPALDERRRVQRVLHERGFPCTRPLLGPIRVGGATAFVDEWVEAPQRDLHHVAARSHAAALLARLVRHGPPAAGLPRALEPAPGSLYPQPHHPRFDLARPDGAWIDEIAARVGYDARNERVVGHADWSAKNFGWQDDRIAVVYDWPDSVVSDTEEVLVGHASAIFPATWDPPGGAARRVVRGGVRVRRRLRARGGKAPRSRPRARGAPVARRLRRPLRAVRPGRTAGRLSACAVSPCAGRGPPPRRATRFRARAAT